MEELISPSSSSSPPPVSLSLSAPLHSLLPSPACSPLQYRLQCLLHSRPEWWAYGIFWHASADRTTLSFGDGHFRGKRAAAASGGSDCGNDCDDTEWFYVVSLTRTFAVGDGTAPTRAYGSLAPVWLVGDQGMQACGCERSREAHLHGIQTLVCIPAAGGVLELGSSDVVGENWVLVQQASSLLSAPEDVAVFSQLTVKKAHSSGVFAGVSSSVDSEHSDSEEE
ncbi:hypothetical protein HPP92_014630 [Vanilla planifolia]|uniref:Transcription factor n=1 Tax=Vanilla planifolia TaxID=51239 RepID=A0A835QQF3_VANPL|nr:hypothetical protein HPP92_014630 [Vanilla planifolia]